MRPPCSTRSPGRAVRPGDGRGAGYCHPALAFPHGAAPEIIDHGRTGYLCHDQDEMTAAIARVHQISRRQCRAAAEPRFSLTRMAADSDRLYRTILERPGQPAPERTGTGAP